MQRFRLESSSYTCLVLMFALCCGSAVAQDTTPDGEPLEIIYAADVEEIKQVKDAFAKALMAVTSCVNGNESTRGNCVCQHRRHWEDFEYVLSAMLASHPDWVDKFLKYQNELQQASLSVPALTKAASQTNTERCS